MSDLIIFIIGIGVFAITTTATLLYGYTSFSKASRDQGIGEDTIIDARPDDEVDEEPGDIANLLSIPVEITRASPSAFPATPRYIQAGR